MYTYIYIYIYTYVYTHIHLTGEQGNCPVAGVSGCGGKFLGLPDQACVVAERAANRPAPLDVAERAANRPAPLDYTILYYTILYYTIL